MIKVFGITQIRLIKILLKKIKERNQNQKHERNIIENQFLINVCFIQRTILFKTFASVTRYTIKGFGIPQSAMLLYSSTQKTDFRFQKSAESNAWVYYFY